MIVLASKSPRRASLLSNVGIENVQVIPANIDESVYKDLSPKDMVKVLSSLKATHVKDTHFTSKNDQSTTIIGCDTVVFINETVLGKPKTFEQAQDMLKLLSGNWHTVFTGFHILHIPSGSSEVLKSYSDIEQTKVKMKNICQSDIDKYVKSGSPFDKAGGYGIQDFGATFVEMIQGDFYNVMGLPLCKVYSALQSLNAL